PKGAAGVFALSHDYDAADSVAFSVEVANAFRGRGADCHPRDLTEPDDGVRGIARYRRIEIVLGRVRPRICGQQKSLSPKIESAAAGSRIGVACTGSNFLSRQPERFSLHRVQVDAQLTHATAEGGNFRNTGSALQCRFDEGLLYCLEP